MNSMRAVYYDSFRGPITLKRLPVPEPPDHGVLVRVKATGICRSDWYGWQGFDKTVRLPNVPGHEFSGIVEAVGAGVKLWEGGERVTAPFAMGCGRCNVCEGGDPQVCPAQTQPGFTHWGSFAEYVVVNNADFNLVRLPGDIDFTTAATLGCRWGTAFRAVVDQGEVSAGKLVGVFGCGGVGLAAVQIAVAHGARVLAIDIRDDKLARAKALGAEFVLNTKEQDFVPEVVRSMSGGGLDITVDALGKPGIIQQALLALRPRGKHIQVGLMEDEIPEVPMDRIIAAELEILGSHGIQAARYGAMFELISAGKCDPGRMISGIISLDQSPRILERMGETAPLGVAIINMEM